MREKERARESEGVREVGCGVGNRKGERGKGVLVGEEKLERVGSKRSGMGWGRAAFK